MVNFPTSKDTLTNPNGNDTVASVNHANQHANANDAIEALQDKVGIDSSADANSLDYLVKNASSEDPGHTHSISSLSAFDLTGVQDGDILKYESASGKIKPNTTDTPDASATVAGKVEIATQAEIDAGTATGGTGASLVADPSALAASIYGTRLPTSDEKDALAGTGTPNSSNKYVTDDDVASAATASKVARRNATGDITVPSTPTANTDAASKSYVDAVPQNFANGTATRAGDAATGSQTIAHGLSSTPSYVRLTCLKYVGTNVSSHAFAAYNGTTNSGVNIADQLAAGTAFEIYDSSGNYQAGTISVDGTNITISWTKTGSPNSNNINIMWEAIG